MVTAEFRENKIAGLWHDKKCAEASLGKDADIRELADDDAALLAWKQAQADAKTAVKVAVDAEAASIKGLAAVETLSDEQVKTTVKLLLQRELRRI